MSVTISDWDERTAYAPGAVVRYWGAYYRAARPISTPLLFGNDAPDSTDAWYAMKSTIMGKGGGGGHGGGHHGGHGRGGFGPGWYGPEIIEIVDEEDIDDLPEILGMFDMGQIATQMNTLKTVPVSVARILLKNGQDAIGHARTLGSEKNLPGGTARDNVYYKLQWHQGALAPMSDPSAIYASGDDLKRWVTQAFIESNAVDEGAQWIADVWTRMWSDIKIAIAALPAQVRAAVSSAVESITGVPVWAFAVGGVGLVGLAAWFVYKLAGTPAGSAAVGAYVGRRR